MTHSNAAGETTLLCGFLIMVKKATTPKKAPAKKVAAVKKKATTPTVPGAPRKYSFDILSEEGEEIVETMTQVVHAHFGAKKHKSTSFQSAEQVRSSKMPLRHIMLQWLFSTYGLAEKTMLEIIGPEGCGKSTFILTLMGYAMKAGCPCYFQNTETKELSPDRMMRCLSDNIAESKVMLNRLLHDTAHSLDESIEKLEAAVEFFRGRLGDKKSKRKVPLDTPIMIAVDVWSKLMAAGEAAGFYDYGSDLTDAAVKKTLKAVGTGSNMGHSKFAAAWCRRLPAWLEKNNVLLIISSHQNDKVDMGAAGAASFIPADVKAMYNKTKIGGRAFNQTSAYQVIIGRKAKLKNSQQEIVGQTLQMRVDKNSYGPSDRKIEYDLISEGLADTETFQQSALDFDRSFARWIVSKKLLGASVTSGLFTSTQLGVTGVTATALCRALESDTAALNHLGAHLGIEGYDFEVEQAVEALQEAPAIELPEPPVEELPAPPEDEQEGTDGESNAGPE